jgi:hypothetical protein
MEMLLNPNYDGFPALQQEQPLPADQQRSFVFDGTESAPFNTTHLTVAEGVVELNRETLANPSEDDVQEWLQSKKLRSVHLASTVEVIGDRCFEGHSLLASVNLEDTRCHTIGEREFSDNNLAEIRCPSTLLN